jgi:hypothetical protein
MILPLRYGLSVFFTVILLSSSGKHNTAA